MANQKEQQRCCAETLYIEPGSPWENGYCESFNSMLRDEFLNTVCPSYDLLVWAAGAIVPPTATS